MPANNETRILKSNTLEELRQKSNEVSLHLGDNALIDSRILDKTVEYTATASQTLFTSGPLRFELKPEETIDDVSAGESFNVGLVKVFQDGTELVQGIAAGQFKVPNYVGSITLSNISSAADVDEFIEDAVIYQGSSLASATWQGKVLDCTTTLLRLKTKTGTFSASTLIKVNGGTDTIVGANHGDINVTDSAYGVMIELNTAASAGDVIKVVSHNLVDAINEVQDDVGDITTLNSGIPLRSDVVVAVNSFKGEVGNATDLNTTAQVVVTAINEHETDIGTMSLNTTATNLTAAINEHDSELGTITAGAMGTTASTVSTAIAELHTDVDARLKLTSGSSQTLNTDATFTNGNTLVFPTGSTLDIRNGLLQTGAGGLSVSTAYIDFNADLNERGLSFERSDFGNGVDVKLVWDEAYAASQPDRAFRVIGLNTGSTTETADLVTFYNAQDLIANNTETGIDVTWDSTNQNFDFALSADPTITLAGDLSGSVELTNLTSGTLTATIAAGSVENAMLAGSIAASKLAGSIGNSKLTNSSITVSDGSNTSPVALGGTLTFAGTSGEVEVSENAGTVTVGLPNNVTVGGNLTITGNLDVNGTQTTINTSTLEIDDTLVLMGASATEPSTGGFGLETRSFTGVGTHSNNAANVTGSHSIVYNFATDRWEADGSLILSEATLGVPSVAVDSGSNIDLSSSRRLHFTDGSGINITGALSGSDIDINVINTDKGSDQFIFRNVAVSGQSTIIADSNDGQLTIAGANGITPTTNAGTDTLTLTLANTAVTAASYGSQFSVPSITVDAQGRITSASNNTAITLGNLGYTGATDANNYSFNITGDSGSANVISSGETFDIEGGTNCSTVVSNNKIIINSVNTEYTTATGLTDNNFTNALKTKLDGISASANNYAFLVSAEDTAGTGTVSNGNTLSFTDSGGASVTRSGNAINIHSENTTYSSSSFSVTGLSGYSSNNGQFLRRDGVFATPSYPTVPGVGDNGLTAKNFTVALFNKLNGITAGATSNTGTVTSVSGLNGINVSSGTTTPTISLNGTYSGNWAVSGSGGNITASGNITAFASDMRLKDRKSNISNALEKVESLSGFNYTFNEEGIKVVGEEQRDENQIGVSAQEVEAILPEIVKPAPGNKDYKTVQYERLVPLLIEAIKELNAEIKELKKHK